MPDRNQPFILPDDTPRSSKTTINIAGICVYLYGVDELSPEQAKDTTVLLHIHGRTRTYKDAEDLAHQLLFEIRQRGGTRKGLVLATLDNRNHGTKVILSRFKTGRAATEHMRAVVQDMLSMIDGIVADAETVMKYLESYVDGIFFPAQFIATGLSLGGHVTWNLLAEVPSITTAIIIVGSPNLTDLMLQRLGEYTSTFSVPQGTKEWPRSIEKLYRARDKSVSQIAGKKILVLNGTLDTLVPSKFTRPWVEQYAKKNDVTLLEQENGHWLSYNMMDKMADWVWHLLI